jgi:F0F1-type ATP synthase assembly protein I
VLIAVFLQAVVTLLAGIVVGLVWGPWVGLSLVVGGGSVVVPNALLALRLRASQPQFAPTVLLVGEFVKIGLTVGLLVLAVFSLESLSWAGLLSGVVLALKALLLAPWLQRRIDRRRASEM